MFDVIVVGARCAGSPLAMLLARKGMRVSMVDKARFPSDTVSTHLIWQAGLRYAKKWGILDRLYGLGAPPIRTVRMDVGPFALAGTPPPVDGIEAAIAPRRTVLDAVLVDEAVKAGAELLTDVYVNELLYEDGRVVGIRGRSGTGSLVEQRAKLVVGADGCQSFVAHSVGAEKYNVRPSGSCAYYAYWRGGPSVQDFEIHMRGGWGGGLFPVGGGLTCLVTAWTEEFHAADQRPDEGYQRVLRGVPRMAEFLDSAEQAGPASGRRDLGGYFRKSSGPGWALAGDAAYHRHPLTAQGITDSFRDADMLAEAIVNGDSDLEAALAECEKRRVAAVMPMYESTCMRATLAPPPPDVVGLFRALRNDQEQADRFFGTDAGTVSMQEFFSPENLGSIMRRSKAVATN